MLARKITNKGTKKNIGKFPSLKMQRIIWYESLLELDYIYLLEYDEDVIAYYEQSCRLHFTYKGTRRHYTPDFHVQKNSGRLIVEVKPSERLSSERNVLLFRIASQICSEYGYEFVVVTDQMIRGQLLENIKLLYKYAKIVIHPQHQILCHEFFAKTKTTVLDEFMQFFISRNIELQVVYALIYWGILAVDLTQAISLNSSVCLPTSASGARKVS